MFEASRKKHKQVGILLISLYVGILSLKVAEKMLTNERQK